MERVLAARVEVKKTAEARPRRLRRAAGVLAGTLLCFFVLKAAAVAFDPQAFPGPPPEGAGAGARILFWIAGADPVSSTLAAALRSSAAATAVQSAG